MKQQSLRAQNVRDRLEGVIVGPLANSLDLDESDVADFHQVRIVEIGTMTSTAKSRVAGMRQASGPVVAFVEDHSYPANGWAQALIEAHLQPWAAVGLAMAKPSCDVAYGLEGRRV